MEQTMYYETHQTLLKLIEAKRTQMHITAKYCGMESEETLRLSQELDDLILDYQRAHGGSFNEAIKHET